MSQYDYAVIGVPEDTDAGIQFWDVSGQDMSKEDIIDKVLYEAFVPDSDMYKLYLYRKTNDGDYVIVNAQSLDEVLLFTVENFMELYTKDLADRFPETAKLLSDVQTNEDLTKAIETINTNPELYVGSDADRVIGVVDFVDEEDLYLEE